MERIYQKNRFKKVIVLGLAVLFALASLTGCSTTGKGGNTAGAVTTDPAANVSQSTGEKIVKIAISSDPSFTFNAIGDGLMVTNGLLREGLTRYGDGVLTDGLAESYEHNDDYTKWTFHLRESGWNNG
ncbi:MAG: hypothetical protein K6E62_03485 [Lachnospiraceae bacterium]|nr:hypothetical protein [Lachnospiraceae bacterium]